MARIEFAAEDLPADVLAVASVRDDVLLFVCDRDRVLHQLQSVGIDAWLRTVNSMMAEAMHDETPVRLRAVS